MLRVFTLQIVLRVLYPQPLPRCRPAQVGRQSDRHRGVSGLAGVGGERQAPEGALNAARVTEDRAA